MAMPKTIETRCRSGSMQARHFMQRLYTQRAPSLHLFISDISLRAMLLDYWEEYFGKKMLTELWNAVLTTQKNGYMFHTTSQDILVQRKAVFRMCNQMSCGFTACIQVRVSFQAWEMPFLPVHYRWFVAKHFMATCNVCESQLQNHIKTCFQKSIFSFAVRYGQREWRQYNVKLER